MSKVTILNAEGKETGSLDIPDHVIGQRINTRVLHQAITMYRASLRQGTASTKERAQVSGGGKKPYRQKGTGRARAGSSRSPLWVGGGVTFGPHPRDFGYTLPKKVKKAALRESIKSKIKEKDLVCIDDLKQPFNKTKEMAQILKALKLSGKILAVLDGSDASVQRVTKNIRTFNLMRSEDVNAFDILKNKKLLITKTGIKKLFDRLEKDSAQKDEKE